MSPLNLVGILVTITTCIIHQSYADVKHVLEGSAHPPNSISPHSVNLLLSSNTNTNSNGDYWWMNSNSPLKAAVDFYKNCKDKNNCPSSSNDASNFPAPFRPSDTVNINIKKNPFFNGDYKTGSGSASLNNKIDLSKNPFLSGTTPVAGNGQVIAGSQDGFLGVQPVQPYNTLGKKKPGFATIHPLEQEKNKPSNQFAVQHPLQEQEKTVECRGGSKACVDKELCVNGVINHNGLGLLQVRSDVQYCNKHTEVCCQKPGGATQPENKLQLNLPNLNEITSGKSSIPESGIKFHGGQGISPGFIQILPAESNIKPEIHLSGENGQSSTIKSIRDVSSASTVDYSDTRFDSDVRFGSTFQGPAYLPPIGGPSPQPLPSTPRPATYQPAPSVPTRPPPRPFEIPVFVQPSVNQQFVSPPVSTVRPFTSSTSFVQQSTTNREYLPPRASSPSSSVTQYVQNTTPKPYQPSTPKPFQPNLNTGTPYQPAPSSPRPYQPAPSTQRPYQPALSTSKPYQPAPSTQQQYQPSPSSPRPYQPAPSTSRPYQPAPSTLRPYQPAPSTSRPYQPAPSSPRPYQPSPSSPRPYQPSPSTYQPAPTTQRATTSRDYLPPRSSQPSSPRPNPFIPEEVPARPTQTQAPYRPSPTQAIYTSQPLPTQQPYRPSPSQPAPVQTQPPYRPSPTQPQYRPSPTQPQYRPSPTQPQPVQTQPPYRPSPVQTQQPYRPSPSTNGYQYPSPSSPLPSSFRPVQQTSTARPYQPSQPAPRPINTNQQYVPPQSTTNFYQPSTPSRVQTTPRPYQTPVTFAQTTPRPYQPPVTFAQTTPRPYQPPVTFAQTPRPYQPPVTFAQTTLRPSPNGYDYPKPTPTFGYPSPTPTPVSSGANVNNEYVRPPPPKTNNGYLPPGPNIEGSGSSNFESSVLTTPKPKPKPFQPDNESGGTNPSGTVIRPIVPSSSQIEQNSALPTSCAAALKCVQEIYCTADGFISPVPVVLTKEQELARVPTTECQDIENGNLGKCCRDPNYKDPWPSANLVNGFDDGQYKEDANLGQYNTQDLQRIVRSDNGGGPRQDYSGVQTINYQQVNEASCGTRHVNTKPAAPGPLDVNFSEIPWQAMVLRDSNRSLLCGGAIIQKDAVLTAAHCVEGLETSDILIKGGEWKLGIDEEPLPFQIVKVVAIVRHPQYRQGSLQNDLAVLVLEEKLRSAKNIGTICLPQPNQIPTENCIATGWGKRILQLHAKGAIMHSIGVKIMDNNQCQETLSGKFQHAVSNFSPNTLCGYSDIDQCKVDYGSALACSNGNNQYTLSGIFAWDTGCKQEGQIGGYVAPDVEWIQTTLSKPLKELKQIDRQYQSQH